MTFDEMEHLIEFIQLGDNRIMGEDKIKYWFELVGFLDVRDAVNGVALHRRESAEYLQPAHVIACARRAKEARLRHENRGRPAIERAPITLDRAQFEADTLAAIETYRAAKGVEQ